jgi:hypothetical protein
MECTRLRLWVYKIKTFKNNRIFKLIDILYIFFKMKRIL